MITNLIRLQDALQMTGISKSLHYLWIKNGLMIPPVKLGKRCAAYPSNEITSINAARIAGKSDTEIKTLVTSLIEKRGNSAD